ncbi:MAG: hypothetical protein OEZ02_10675 [Anaerolineae bacterium]|nr:hypothetical protein [Anaerolineae bacterium]
MSAGKFIAYIISAILIFFGVLFIWGAFSPEGSTGWFFTGGLSVGIGLIIILVASRSKSAADVSSSQNVTLNIDLPSDVNIERFKCVNCGADLSMDNITMAAGAPMVNCPYCNAAYQLTEDPKW